MPGEEQDKKDSTLGEAIASTETTTPAADPKASGAPAPAADPAPAAAAQTPESEDAEDRELREAKEAADREAKGEAEPAAPATASQPAAAPAAATPGSAAAAPASAAAPAASTAKPPEKTVTLPISEVAKMRARASQAQTQAAYEKGRADALAAAAKTGAQPGAAAEPELSPEEQELQDIKSQKQELAKQFDKGQVTMADYEAKRDELEDRAAQLRAAIHAPAPASAHADDLTLAERTAQLETQYPAVKNLSEDETESLVTLAYSQASREGKPIGRGPAATFQLRERVAKLAQTMYGGGQPPAAAPSTPASAPAAPALSPAAQARDKKLEAAASHPPDVTTMGTAATGTGPSEAELEARLNAASTEEEAEAIMRGAPQLVNRMMGRITAP